MREDLKSYGYSFAPKSTQKHCTVENSACNSFLITWVICIRKLLDKLDFGLECCRVCCIYAEPNILVIQVQDERHWNRKHFEGLSHRTVHLYDIIKTLEQASDTSLVYWSLFWSSSFVLIRNERKQSCLKMIKMEDLQRPWRVESIGCVCGRIGEECSDSKGTDTAAPAKGRSPRIQSQHFGTAGIKTLKGRDNKTFEGWTAVSTSLKRVNLRRRETFQRHAM